MRIDTIKHFIVLAQTGSFYKAAEQLFISPQGLNKEITKLEAQLDVALLNRSGREGVTLTKRGAIFLEQARILAANYDTMLEQVMSAPAESDLRSGDQHLEIFCTFHLLHVLLLGRRGAMLPRTVKLTEKEFNEILDIADEGQPNRMYLVELFSTGQKYLDEHPSLVFEEFYQTPMGLAWKTGLVPSLPPVITPEMVHDLPMVTSNYKGTRVWLDYIFRDYPLSNVVSRGTMPAYLFHMAQEGLYAMCDSDGFRLAQQNPASETQGLRFSVLDVPDATARIGLIHKQGVSETDLVRTYNEVVRKILSADL